MQILLKKNVFNFISFHVNEKDGRGKVNYQFILFAMMWFLLVKN